MVADVSEDVSAPTLKSKHSENNATIQHSVILQKKLLRISYVTLSKFALGTARL
jgi:hypothetical protein